MTSNTTLAEEVASEHEYMPVDHCTCGNWAPRKGVGPDDFVQHVVEAALIKSGTREANMNPTILDSDKLPDVDTLIAIARKDRRSNLAVGLDGNRNGVQIRRRVLAHDGARTPTKDENRELLIVSAQWSHYSRYRDREIVNEVTVVQIVVGGLYHGEGSAFVQQYVLGGKTTDEELATVIAFISMGVTLNLVTDKEL